MENSTQRDVVLITVDSLRASYVYDDAGVAEHLQHIGKLADDGTMFTNAFSNAGITKASFLSILSGTYPWMFGPIPAGFDSERPHLAAHCREAGISTAGFNTNPYLSPTYGYDRGFDYYMGRDSDDEIDQTTVSAKFWPILKEALPDSLSRSIRSTYGTVGKKFGIQLGGDPYVSAEAVNESVIEWVSRTSSPRFIWIHYMDVHTPYYPREGTVSEGISQRRAVKLFHKANELRNETPPEDLEVLERLYRGEIEYLDRCLGELFEDLDQHIDVDNSVVAFGSDHGEVFGEHGEVFHPDGVLYDPFVQVPLIVRGPGFERDAVETPVSNADIVPTLLSAANVSVPDECVGTDLSQFVADPSANRTVFAEAHTSETDKVMATNGRYKLIRHLADGSEYLYDRYQNPAETYNRVDDFPAVRTELAAAIDDHLTQVRAPNQDTDSASVEVGDDVKTRLRMLGYDE